MPETERFPPQRVLLVQTQRLGDVVLSTALLEQLHRALPAEIDWLVGEAAAPLLEQHPLVSQRVLLRRGGVRDAARAVRARGYDWILDVQGSWRTALITARSGAPVRVGWKGWNRGWAYNVSIPRAAGSPVVYVVRDRARLLHALGLNVADAAPRLYLTPDERSAGAAMLRTMSRERARIGMLVSTRYAAKDWPADRFAAVARELDAHGLACVVFRAPGGEAQERAFAEAAGDAAVFAPAVSLRTLMSLVAACDVFVSGDTGPAHIATALDVPRVTVHGPTPVEGWTPESPLVIALRGNHTACAACAGPGGRRAHTCLDAVTPQAVVEAVRELLRRAGSGQLSHEEHAGPAAHRGEADDRIE